MKTSKNILALLTLAPVVACADIGWYVGGGAGGTRLEQKMDVAIGAFTRDGENLTPIIERHLDGFTGSDLGYRVFAGMRFGPYLGLEIGYTDLGSPEDSLDMAIPATASSPETDVSLKLADDIHGIDAYLVGTWPINARWEAVAKVGMISWDSTFKLRNAYGEVFPNTGSTVLPTVLPASFSVDTDGTDFAGALGLNYKASDHLTLRAEGTWYDIEGTQRSWLLGGFLIYNF